ncbi:MAG: membrane protein [Lysobacteraceae bacterium]|nr:MAG: membrane protein [Xanthomonadaceae bacterium]
MTAALWILAVLLVVAGLAGIVLPALPGIVLVWAGLLVGAWADGFQRAGWGVIAACTLIMLFALLADLLAGVLGARRLKAHWLALLGAAIGTVAGLATGLIGLVFLPLAGAVAGEWIARHREPGSALRAARVGLATWLGMLVGTAVKIACAFLMIGLFAASLWL